MTKRTLRLVFPFASVVFLGAVAAAAAQSRVAETRAASESAVAAGTANGDIAAQKSRASSARASGRNAKAITAVTAAGAPVALALEDAGPGPASTPEPLSVMLIGGALAGLYGMRKHLS